MKHICDVLSTMPGPEEGPRTNELVNPRMLRAVTDLLTELGFSPDDNPNVAVVTRHADDCPCHDGPSGEFGGCTCEFLHLSLHMMTEDDVKVAVAMGHCRHAGGGSVDPRGAN